MRMLLNHSTTDLMDFRFLALVAGNRKRCNIAFSFGYSPFYRPGSLPKEQQDSTTDTTNRIKNTMTEITSLFCLIWHIHLEVFRFEVTIFKFFGAFFFFKHSRLAWFRGKKVCYKEKEEHFVQSMLHALLPFVALKDTEVDTCIFCLSRDKIIIWTAIMYFYILYTGKGKQKMNK